MAAAPDLAQPLAIVDKSSERGFNTVDHVAFQVEPFETTELYKLLLK